MGQADTPQNVFVNDEGQGSIVCPKCHKQHTISVTSYLHQHEPVNAGCSCGHYFLVLFNTRHYYRKPVQLHGVYTPLGTPAQKRMQVNDLSMTGLGFQTILPHTLGVGDMVEVRFSLDDTQRTEICKRAKIQWVNQLQIGAEFCDRQAFERELGFYLRPV